MPQPSDPLRLHAACPYHNFPGAAWSPDEKCIAYVAEAPAPARTPEWSAPAAGPDGKRPEGAAPKGWRGQGEWSEDWGELNTGERGQEGGRCCEFVTSWDGSRSKQGLQHLSSSQAKTRSGTLFPQPWGKSAKRGAAKAPALHAVIATHCTAPTQRAPHPRPACLQARSRPRCLCWTLSSGRCSGCRACRRMPAAASRCGRPTVSSGGDADQLPPSRQGGLGRPCWPALGCCD